MIISTIMTINDKKFIERKSNQNVYIKKISESGLYQVARDLLTNHFEYVETEIPTPADEILDNKEVN